MQIIDVSHVTHKCKDVQDVLLRTMVQTSYAMNAIMPSITRTEDASTAAR